MDNYGHILPQSKEDDAYIAHLQNSRIEDIKPAIPKLLEWLQDGNWPQAGVIANYLLPHAHTIQDEIAEILLKDDEVWKYWVLLLLIKNANEAPGNRVMELVSRIAYYPTTAEKEEGVDEIAAGILKKFC